MQFWRKVTNGGGFIFCLALSKLILIVQYLGMGFKEDWRMKVKTTTPITISNLIHSLFGRYLFYWHSAFMSLTGMTVDRMTQHAQAKCDPIATQSCDLKQTKKTYVSKCTKSNLCNMFYACNLSKRGWICSLSQLWSNIASTVRGNSRLTIGGFYEVNHWLI